MTDKTIENSLLIGSDYFRIEYSRKSKNNLQYFLDQFDVNNYWIYKSTSIFREVSIEDFYDFNYSGYILFSKNKYDNKNINEKIKILNEKITQGINYFNKPLPSIKFLNKIQKINIII
jgi:hypothetical protein